jgi:arogenate dehydrogenase (NADP+)
MMSARNMQNSTETLEQLERAFDNIKRKLFHELHTIVREQVFPAPVAEEHPELLAIAPGDVRRAEEEAAGSGAEDEGHDLVDSMAVPKQ